MNQVFISIFLLENIGLKKIYGYKFSGKQACPNKDALGSAVCQVSIC